MRSRKATRVRYTGRMRSRRSGHAATWWLYLVRMPNGALYTGIALNVAERFAAHCAGRGAKALRGRGPLVLARRSRVGARALALRVEHRVKRLPKAYKERLVAAPRVLRRLIASVCEQARSPVSARDRIHRSIKRPPAW